MKQLLQRAEITAATLSRLEQALAVGDMVEVERIRAGIDPMDLMAHRGECRIAALAFSDTGVGAGSSEADGTPAPAPHLRPVPCE